MTVERFDPPANVPAMLNPQVDAWIQRLEPCIRLTELTYNSSMIPAGMKGKREDVLAAFIRAADLGLPPFTGIGQMHVISGKVGISAELMRALILRAGHELHIAEATESRCVIRGRRSGWTDWTSASFTMQEAVKAGYTRKNPNYTSSPTDMLLARATTRLARMVFADVIAGLRSSEELADMDEVTEYVPQMIPQTSTKVSRQGATPAPAVEGGTDAATPGGMAAPEGTGEVPQAGAAEEQTAAPARKRAPLKPRGRATQPVPEPTPEPEPEADEEPVEAELVPDAPEAEASNVRPLDAARSAAKDGMVRTVQMQFERLLGKPVDREERLWYTGLIVGRVVGSTNDLDGDDLRKLLKTLERLRNREQLEALNQGGE